MTWGAKTFILCLIFSMAYTILIFFGGGYVVHSHSYAMLKHSHKSSEIHDFKKRVVEIINECSITN